MSKQKKGSNGQDKKSALSTMKEKKAVKVEKKKEKMRGGEE